MTYLVISGRVEGVVEDGASGGAGRRPRHDEGVGARHDDPHSPGWPWHWGGERGWGGTLIVAQ